MDKAVIGFHQISCHTLSNVRLVRHHLHQDSDGTSGVPVHFLPGFKGLSSAGVEFSQVAQRDPGLITRKSQGASKRSVWCLLIVFISLSIGESEREFFDRGTLTTIREPAAVPVVGLNGC